MAAGMAYDQEALEALKAELRALPGTPTEEAHTLPPGFFTSSAFFALEQEHLFRREWVCLGHESDIPEPGDYITGELAGEPLIVCRDGDRQVRVLSNVCRHRGNILLQGTGNKRTFVCSYHAWSYGLDGRVKSAPHMDKVAGFDKAACRLPVFASEVWRGFVFVNLADRAEPLAKRLGALEALIENYGIERRKAVLVEEESWAANWKCLVENFMEAYHLSPMHPKTLHPMMPTTLCERLEVGEGCSAYRANYRPGTPQRTPFPEALTEHERSSSLLFSVFPNLVIALGPSTALYLCIFAEAPGALRIRWGLLAHPGEEGMEAARSYEGVVRAFNAEDKATLENLQKGLGSRHLARSPLAPADYEGTIWDFYLYLARRLGQNGALD